MARQRRFKVPKQGNYILQLTAMVDMFTILLVFLLLNYSDSPYHITPHEDLSLPVSSTMETVKESLKIILTREGLYIEDMEVAKLNGSDFSKEDIDINDPDFIKPLFTELEARAKAEDAAEYIKEGSIIFQADSKHSYGMLRKVMYTASMAGFPKLNMATISSN